MHSSLTTNENVPFYATFSVSRYRRKAVIFTCFWKKLLYSGQADILVTAVLAKNIHSCHDNSKIQTDTAIN